ncbi:MAG: S9 family peptidase [Bacteroidetes bacterium]|nr:S9 family peptidase [Bacteroidota bacterium]MBS1941209.1 S9 family peptidase [Bacteroidota bacterium]
MSTEPLHSPPKPVRDPQSSVVNGVERTDEYAWMRLTEEQRNAKAPDAHTRQVIDHLTKENAYAEQELAPVAGLRNALYAEMKGRIKESDLSVPYRENGFWYRYRYDEGAEYPVHMRASVLPNREEIPAEFTDFLDEQAMASGYDYFDLADFEIAPGNNLMAYSVDTVGRRRYEIRFRDLASGMELADVITHAGDGGAFADDRTFFYVRKDRTLRNARVFRHVVGTDPATDVEVFHEKNRAFSCEVYRSRSDSYVIISTESTLSSEHRLLRASDPFGEFQTLFQRGRKHEMSIMHIAGVGSAQGKFYILTNWKARNFRLMECPEDRTGKEFWTEVIPHRADVLLEDVDVFRDHLVVTERKAGLSHLRILQLSTGNEHEVGFHDPAYVAFSGTNPEWDTTKFRYGYASLTTPTSIFEHDLGRGGDVLLKQQEVLGGFDAERYVSERIWVTAQDGTRVPVSLVYRRDTPLSGRSPLLLYGYGAYGINVEPVFSSNRLSLLDRGFVFAIAHVRGGEELGRAWYENGRMEQKMNTFTDFIACAEHLVAKGYADPKRLYCMGGSAGGLLVGAVVNMRPDLWDGAVAEVPFVDVVNTMLDAGLPLTTGEYDEWGDPRELEAFQRILGYSPYDNIHDADYPAILSTTGFHDSQVQYWEPAKWVARLREHQQGKRPILLWTNMEAGHGGASGRFERLTEVARIYAFLLGRAFPQAALSA